MTRRLAVVPDPVLRDGVYVRVSALMGREDDRFLSPAIQREQIDRARGRGPASTVVEQWDDIDVSTRVKASDRPGLQAALAAAREGRIDRLWVLTLDRFDRDTAALRVFDEVASLGVQLWTEAGRVDVETPEGYLSTTMQLAIARYQRDRIGKAWRQAHQHRLEAGLPHSGKARFGYVYDREQRIHVPDPVTGPVLAEAYRRYNAGESVYSLVRWLNDQDIKTTSGGAWRDRVLRRVMDSGFAAGVLTYGDATYPGRHQPLIDDATWAAFQSARATRRVAPNTERSQYVLSGLVRCGHCGAAMVAGQFGAQRKPKYRCSQAKEAGNHTGGYVMAEYVEAQVLAWLRALADDVAGAADRAQAAASRATRRQADVQLLSGEVEAIDAKMIELTVALVDGRVEQAHYELTRAHLSGQRDDLLARLVKAQADAAAPVARMPSATAGLLLQQWGILDVARRRQLLRELIDRVVVTAGRPRSLVEVVPR
jgi:DNA invertase Pin-like site-specific DNA recombinase